MSRRKTSSWRPATWGYFSQVKEAIDDLQDYWPVTLRQVYYRLVAAEVIENNRAAYVKLSNTLKPARMDGLVPWEAMEDRSRVVLDSAGWTNRNTFIADETDRFLDGYRRNLLQSQEHAIELWIEKDALSHVCYDVAFSYCVPVVVARGFSSVSQVDKCRNRIVANKEAGYSATVVLYFGDLDPSGWEMLPAMMKTLQVEMRLGDQVIPRRCALVVDQVEEYDLPHNPEALKWTDTRARKYVDQFGELAVELDALPPATLQDVVRQSIERELDLSQFRHEQARESEERDELADLKARVVEFLGR